MEVKEYLDKMMEVQNLFLTFLDDENINQNNLIVLINYIDDQRIRQDKHHLTSFLHLFSSIVDYHHRTINFYDKSFQIILFLKDDLKRNYSNLEIFNFFRNNCRIILFLIEEKIIYVDYLITSMCLNFTFNDYIQKKTFSSKYYYLFPEIKPFLDKNCEVYLDSQTQEDIKEQRKVEYADNYILQLVQTDLIDEFISYINKTNFKLNDEIKKSLLETNIFLSNINSLKLIDYAAFFGSVQIFKYLISRNCEMTPKLMLFAIHGRKPEIIHIIEEKNIIQDEKIYKDCLKFAIRCHHNELAHYILENYVDENDEEISSFIFKNIKRCALSCSFRFFRYKIN